MTRPRDPAAGGDRLRAGHADREQTIEALKTAFIDGRLTGEELDARTGQALAARTYADLDALAADIPGAPPLGGPAVAPDQLAAAVPGPLELARRWPVARAAVKAGTCLVVATAIAYSGNLIDNADPNGHGPGPHHGWTRLLLLLVLALMITSVVILVRGVTASVEQRRSPKELPPSAWPDGSVQKA